jgi:hypothetical protein
VRLAAAGVRRLSGGAERLVDHIHEHGETRSAAEFAAGTRTHVDAAAVARAEAEAAAKAQAAAAAASAAASAAAPPPPPRMPSPTRLPEPPPKAEKPAPAVAAAAAAHAAEAPAAAPAAPPEWVEVVVQYNKDMHRVMADLSAPLSALCAAVDALLDVRPAPRGRCAAGLTEAQIPPEHQKLLFMRRPLGAADAARTLRELGFGTGCRVMALGPKRTEARWRVRGACGRC